MFGRNRLTPAHTDDDRLVRPSAIGSRDNHVKCLRLPFQSSLDHHAHLQRQRLETRNIGLSFLRRPRCHRQSQARRDARQGAKAYGPEGFIRSQERRPRPAGLQSPSHRSKAEPAVSIATPSGPPKSNDTSQNLIAKAMSRKLALSFFSRASCHLTRRVESICHLGGESRRIFESRGGRPLRCSCKP